MPALKSMNGKLHRAWRASRQGTGMAMASSANRTKIRFHGTLTMQVLWGCIVRNATPEQEAHGLVTDLFQRLAEGKPITVYVAGEDGCEHMIEALATVVDVNRNLVFR
jgi:hypothetical protein